ncbi:MAG: hypothetical protein LUH36_03040, partial [Oscillospiraceae bacterium]|nr:hypothetical protein [Oscillospiraceae bacterium]
ARGGGGGGRGSSGVAPDPTISATIIIGDAAGTEAPAETGESGTSPALLIGVILVIVGCGAAAIGIVIWSRRYRR